MKLPSDLEAAIEEECSGFSLKELRGVSEQLSRTYQKTKSSSRGLFQERAGRSAYLAVRMPATYAAIIRVLGECKKRMEGSPLSLLDLGAGPGTGAWAAAELFDSLKSVTLIEESLSMVGVGKRLMEKASFEVLRNAKWDVRSLEGTLPKADLALLSYVACELSSSQLQCLLEELWKSCSFVVFIEPGTPVGYRRILEVREWVIENGAFLVAPCPHREACPMKAPDWCHFPARVERSRRHKFLKSGSLGYEDEKFSYIAFSKEPTKQAFSRIIGPVQKKSGFVQLPLCLEGQINLKRVFRRDKDYRLARNAQWGDGWM